MADAAGACQAVWLVRLLGDITGVKVQPPLLKMDNQFAIALSKNPILRDRRKHIDIKFHFILVCGEREDLRGSREHRGAARGYLGEIAWA